MILISNNQLYVHSNVDALTSTGAVIGNLHLQDYTSNNAMLVDIEPPPYDVPLAYRYDDGVWVVEDSQLINDYITAQNQYVGAYNQVPPTISARQARLALLSIDKLADVDTALAALPSPQREQAQVEWEYASQIERQHPFVTALGTALGMDDAQIDDLFRVGVSL
ncbi:MAG: hypothetical protein AB7D03_03880 [Thiomicrospira sp.]